MELAKAPLSSLALPLHHLETVSVPVLTCSPPLRRKQIAKNFIS